MIRFLLFFIGTLSILMFQNCGDIQITSLNGNSEFPNNTPVETPSKLQISAGYESTCALRSDGFWCWGNNRYQKFASSEVAEALTPLRLQDSEEIISIENGYSKIYFITSNHELYYKGIELPYSYGGTPATSQFELIPGLEYVENIRDFNSFRCTTDSQALKCWGTQNFSLGYMGVGHTNDVPTPTPVLNLHTSIQQYSLSKTSCALLIDNSLMCWGNNDYEQIGPPSTDTTTPYKVEKILEPILSVATSRYHICVIVEGGNVKCWGGNESGQLGDGTVIGRALPITLDLPTPAKKIAVAFTHGCALLENNELYCWGYNYAGEIGNPDIPLGTRTPPVPVLGLNSGKIIDVSLSQNSSSACAIFEDESVQCWGWNEHGQLGDGTKNNRNTPTNVLFPEF